MNRREFLAAGVTATAAMALTPSGLFGKPAHKLPIDKLPLYKGFNLLEKFSGMTNERYRESDFALMAEWGFNFARLPMSYWTWGDVNDWSKIDESTLEHIDEAVEFGRQYGVHVNLNFHRAPGYCINNGDAEPYQLFEDEKALEATRHHWQVFARRYKGISNQDVSFDLLNEPPVIPESQHNPVMRAIIEGIREVDPDRLIVMDGISVGRKPVMGMADAGVVQSTRGYDPIEVSHYRAEWMREHGSFEWPEPTWPLTTEDGRHFDQAKLKETIIDPWLPLAKQGVPVHVGEWGCYNKTPHDVALAYMEAMLQLWQEQGWGWALWNLRGDFGPLDSKRADVKYESYKGHQLDRKMLELLQQYS
ncbi:MAG: glycoside hydrolase [Puniceicoccaceae bacterium 5H]|nr:MAG: glycoside hydrolase [Puniceicoccaceae bacterium 5H]